jgi:hypothetical protein
VTKIIFKHQLKKFLLWQILVPQQPKRKCLISFQKPREIVIFEKMLPLFCCPSKHVITSLFFTKEIWMLV